MKTLNVEDNALGPIGVAQIEEMLRTSETLTRLNLTNCGLGPEASTTISRALLANENTKLTEIQISRSRVENDGARALAEYLSSYNSLKKLVIYQNAIGREEDGMSPLLESLLPHAQSGSLKHLDINDNYITTDESVEALCQIIREGSSLEYLNIDGNNISDDEHRAKIVEALQESEYVRDNLKHFSWSYDIDEDCDLLRELIDYMKGLEYLETLGLADTMVDLEPRERNELRRKFARIGKRLVLSERQKNREEDEHSSSSEDDE